ncbi:DnaJ heat shock N-terminal domain-containing protein, partial [Trifolium medium]|nr:DnaJ heat shock N-terminal domain-containing protein [Trifolium medium]
DYCQFYLGEGASEGTCGQRKGMNDIPRLLVIRYLRNSSAVDARTQELSKFKSLLVQDIIDDSDQAGQFVAGYKGTADVSE